VKRTATPADPEAERRELRQLTRELHEAAQGARDAAKELRAARNEVREDFEKILKPYIDEHLDYLADKFNETREFIVTSLRESCDSANEQFAAQFRFNSVDEWMRELAKMFTECLYSPETIARIATYMADNTKLDTVAQIIPVRGLRVDARR
jgi:uncharacterized coiled-coil DUF342 family protein